MKQTPLFLIFILLIMLACSDSNSDNANQNGIVNAVSSGTWRITYFFDTDSDETNDFAGYNFTFGSSSILTATNGATTNSGTWSVTDSNSNDDSLDDIHFNIGFDTPDTFEELSDDWDIIEYSSTRIKLIDVSGGNGGTDYLTFEKN